MLLSVKSLYAWWHSPKSVGIFYSVVLSAHLGACYHTSPFINNWTICHCRYAASEVAVGQCVGQAMALLVR
jgi:hypothetical protein